jgi:hypothetical protein
MMNEELKSSPIGARGFRILRPAFFVLHFLP